MELVQGSDEWKIWRRKRLGASDAAIVMGVSPWKTRYQLWFEKTGREEKYRDQNREKKPLGNWAIDRGNRLEPMVRSMYELRNDIPMDPIVLVHPKYEYIMASLDGFNAEHKRILEIKVPGKETIEKAKRGEVALHYALQLEQQLYVSGAESAHFYVAEIANIDGRERIKNAYLVDYKSDPELQAKLISELHKFWELITTDTPPELTDKDTLVLEGDETRAKFAELRSAIQVIESFETAKKRRDELEKEITPLITHPRVTCAGVKVIKRCNKKDGPYLDIKLAG